MNSTRAQLRSRAPNRLPVSAAGKHGIVVIYALILMVAVTGLCSLAVDYGRVQMVKSEMQRCADATARGYMQMYNVYGKSYADAHVAALYAQSANPINAGSTASTYTVTFGSWNAVSHTFVASAGAIPAVQASVTRTNANGNGMQLIWTSLIGIRSIDIHTSAVAALMGGDSATMNVSALSNPYFAGMPSTTTNAWGDNMTTDAPTQVASIPVIPGTYLTFSSFSGTTSVVPGYVAYTGAAGNPGIIVNHGENWDHSFNNPGAENGIADAKMPEDAMMGVFLTNSAPSSSAAPSGQVDWTSSTMSNQATYSSLVVKQPFMIGTGQTTGGTTKSFLVPPGATRLFVGVWDGVQYSNNGGSITGTVGLSHYVELVQ